ncbi:hypothetical protein D3C78_1664670 [compost metagenome]
MSGDGKKDFVFIQFLLGNMKGVSIILGDKIDFLLIDLIRASINLYKDPVISKIAHIHV